MRSIFILSAVAALAVNMFAGTIENIETRKQNDARRSINVLRVASAVVDTETVTIGSTVFEVDTTSTAGITSGRTRLNLSGGSTAAAVGTLTSDNTNVADAATVTIGSEVYTFKTALTPTEGEVLIGADADASLLNLIRAINHSGTPGTDYSNATADANVTAATSVTSHAFLVTAKIPGAGANSLATLESSTHLSWGGSTLASGVSPTAAEFTTALNTAINAANVSGQSMASTRVSANEILLESYAANAPATACTETLAGSNNAWANATMYGGSAEPTVLRSVEQVQRAANATEAALQTMHFIFPFTPTAASVQVRTSAGVLVAFDGSVVIGTAGHVDVNGTGSTDVSSTDLVTVTVSN